MEPAVTTCSLYGTNLRFQKSAETFIGHFGHMVRNSFVFVKIDSVTCIKLSQSFRYTKNKTHWLKRPLFIQRQQMSSVKFYLHLSLHSHWENSQIDTAVTFLKLF